MATLTAVLGAAAPTTTIEFGGKTYKPRRLTWSVLSEMEQWLIDRARNEFVKTMTELFRAGVYTAPQVTTEVKAFVREVVDEGHYSFGSEAMNNALGTDKADEDAKGKGGNLGGQMRLIALVLNCSEAEVVELMTHRKDEVMAYVQQLVAESLPAPK